MASTFQFVDAIASSPTVRLDLNAASSGFSVKRDGLDLSPPAMRRASVSTLLADGETITAAAYSNRTVKLPVQLVAKSASAVATALSNLARELNRPMNILKVQLDSMPSPVFFRTFRSPDYALDLQRIRAQYTTVAALEIPAEPFGYGLRVTGSPVTVNNDPANATNPCRFDVTGVTGDVETPALILADPGANAFAPVLTVRRHGTPSNLTGYFQAESGTLGTDTTSVGSVTAHSNSTVARVSFSTVATMATRVTLATVPGSAGTDVRGTYRVLVMAASSNATSTYGLRFKMVESTGSTDLVVGDTATFVPPDTGRYLTDLGLIQVPVGVDPGFDGYGAAVNAAALSLQVQASRLTGAGSLDLDFVAVVPVGEEYTAVGAAPDAVVLDGPNDTVWTPDGSGNVSSTLVPLIPRIGSLPMLTPNQTNRFWLLRPDGLAGGTAGRGQDTKSRTTSVTGSYWPRFLVVAQ